MRVITEPGNGERRPKLDLTDKRFLKLTVLRFHGVVEGVPKWLCKCECGNETLVNHYSLLKGATRSCGCLVAEVASARCKDQVTHGRSRTPLWYVWQGMLQRCKNSKHRSYKDYGGRGITVCERWKGRGGFEAFIEDMGERPSDRHEIDRIDNDGPYCKENCRWSTDIQQSRNSRHNRLITFDGKTQCLSAWAEELGLPYFTLTQRIYKGWSVERALTTPRMSPSEVGRVSSRKRWGTNGLESTE